MSTAATGMSLDPDRRGLGLVLAGGAARGAYQAGVLRYLYRELPKNLGFVPWPDVVSGTSVGALNGVFAGARDQHVLDRLIAIWRGLRIDQVYRFGRREAAGFLTAPFRSNDVFALLDGTPLNELIERGFPRVALRRAVDSGATRAVIVSATELASGRNVLFLDSAETDVLVDPRPGVRVENTNLRAVHCVASASIPFLFRPVPIGDRWYVDGGLRMNTPLRPALRSGVDRALVISLMQGPGEGYDQPSALPNLFFLAGKTFNALLLDPVERDLHGAQNENRIVAWGEATYGPGFADQIASDLDIKKVKTLFVRPSQDLGQVAAQLYRSRPPKVSMPVRYLLSRIRDDDNSGEADLLSYLYFDQSYTGLLEQLGFEDAHRMQEELAELVTPIIP